MARLDYVKGSYIRKSSQDFNFNSSRALNNIINGTAPGKLKTNSRLFEVRSLKTRSLKFSGFLDYMLNSSTLRTRTHDIHTVNARPFNSQILSYSIAPFKMQAFSKKRSKSISLIPRSINLNSHTFIVRMRTSSKLNYTVNARTLKTRIFNSRRFNARTVNFYKISNQTLHIPTLRTRTLNSPTFNTHMLSNTLNLHKIRKPIPNAAQLTAQTLNDIIFDGQNLNEWLEDTIVKPIEDIKDSRRSHIDGLMNFKKRVNQINEKKKKLSDFNEDDIIPNDKYELDNVLAHAENVPNFKESFVDKAAERFDKIQSEYLKHKVKEQEKSGRRMAQKNQDVYTLSPAEYEHLYPTTTTLKPNSMDRIIALMNQFIYQSQTRLVNGQLLKMKYVDTVKFKIGYVFALLRILKQQQMTLYSSMHFNRFFPPIVQGLYYTPVADHMYYLILYEKIMRLDDDIVTTVRYLWKLDEERKKAGIIAATKFPKRIKLTAYRGFGN